MRLIDADYFKEQIAAATLKSNIEPNKGLALIEIVDAQPTAFDFESMVEQIKAKATKICCSAKCNDDCKNCEHGLLMKSIIEILQSSANGKDKLNV